MNTAMPSAHMKSMIAAVCFIVASVTIDGTAGENGVMITRSFDHTASYYSHEIVKLYKLNQLQSCIAIHIIM